MDHAIKLERQTISLEALGGRDPLDLFHARLPKFVVNVKNFLKTIIGKGAPAPELVNLSSMHKALEEIGYGRAQRLKTYVPTGMDVTYLEYLEVLEMSQRSAERLQPNVIEPLTNWISEMLTRPEELSSLRTREPKGLEYNDIEAIQKAQDKATDQRRAKTEQPFGDVFKSVSDVQKVEKKANELSERLARINRKDLSKSVEELTGLISTLTKRIEDKEDGYDISAKNIDALSNMIYRTAVEVEHYSVYAHLMEALVSALSDTNEFITNTLK